MVVKEVRLRIQRKREAEMSYYKKGRTPKQFPALEEPLRKFDDDVVRYLNEQDENLDSMLNSGLSFKDNFNAKTVSYTSNASPDTEDTVAHGLGKVPIGVITVEIDKGGVVYKSATYDKTNVYLKCTVAAAAIKILVY